MRSQRQHRVTAACDGRYCPSRDLCQRAVLYDERERCNVWVGSFLLVDRDRQRRGMQCGEWLPLTTNKEQEIER